MSYKLALCLVVASSSVNASYNALLNQAHERMEKFGFVGSQIEMRLEGAGIDCEPDRYHPRWSEGLRLYFDKRIMNTKGYFGHFGFVIAQNKGDWYPHHRADFTLEIGYFFNPLAIRFGLIEGGLGVGADLSFVWKRLEWVSSVEAIFKRTHDYFERRFDRKPFIKWINRFYIYDHILLTAGIDYYTKPSGFIGVGFSF